MHYNVKISTLKFNVYTLNIHKYQKIYYLGNKKPEEFISPGFIR